MKLRALICVVLLALAAAGQDTFQGVERIVAVGDVHGDFEQLVKVLRMTRVIDESNKWIGGKTHLVQTGDIPDRGPDTRKAMDLLMELEKQAKKAGGMVHPLIGNHEGMNIYGDLRYVSPEEFASFRTPDSAQRLTDYFQQELPGLKAQNPAASEDEIRRAWDKTHPPGWVEQRYEFGPRGKYGSWITKHNAVIRVNDLIFMHGGWSPKYADQKIGDLNKAVRGELKDFSKLQGGVTMDAEGPLWYRGLARDPEAPLTEHLDRLLKEQSATAIVMGHTPTAGAVMTRFGGKAILIDVGLSKVYGGPPACLVVTGPRRQAMHRGTLLDLPTDAASMLAYLKAAAALDPAPSPLLKVISAGGGSVVKDDQ